ncbi:MAG: ATP-binding protein [Burkholderiales bacterium]
MKAFVVTSLAHVDRGGDMGARIRAFDWTTTPLGAPGTWPRSLKTAVRIMLDSRYAMWMLWGPDFTFLCNDAYAAQTLGIKRTWAVGASARRVWAEIWPDIGPRIDRVLAGGEATWDEALLLFLERSGTREETYHTFSYSPLPDDHGAIAGMLCVVTEETERVIGERRVKLLRDLAAEVAPAKATREVLDALQRTVRADARDMPFALVFLPEDGGWHCESSDVASASVLCDPAQWPLERALAAGSAGIVLELGHLADHAPKGPWAWPPQRAVCLTIPDRGVEGRHFGVLVAGLNPSRPFGDAYSGFLNLMVGQLAAALASVKSYEAERRRAEALAELDRAKTAFFSNVSHEFRTPLTLMLGPLQEIASLPDMPDALAERFDLVHRNALRLQKLVNALLDFSRIEAGRVRATYEPTDLCVLTRDLASTFRSAIERAGLAFAVDCEAIGEPVFVDREMWEKVVLNLLSNALKFTLRGRIAVRLARRDDRAVLEVEDTGVGVPSADLPRLFERFYRVEASRGRTHEGSGIGLALVQEIVRLHGGTIDAYSVEGRGTTFRVALPLGAIHLPSGAVREPRAEERATAGAQAYVQEALRWLQDGVRATSPMEGVDLRGRDRRFVETFGARIVLADDNADMRNYVTGLLATHYAVEAVADGAQALRAAERDPPDLVVSDVMMPVMDGFALVHALRGSERLRSVPVILLSARAGEESRIEGLDAGADDYLVKPFTASELLARVGALLERTRVRAAAERRLRLGLQAARMFVWDVELPGGALKHSGNAQEILGRDLRNAREGFGIVDPRDRPAFEAKVRGAMRTGKPIDEKVRIVHGRTSELRWLWVRGEATANARGDLTRLSGVTLDITELKRAEDALREADHRKDEFLAMLAHELRNPLAPIRNAADVLQTLASWDARSQSMTRIIARQASHMTELVDDLLDVSRVTRGLIRIDRAPVALRHVIADAIEQTRPLVDGRRHRLSVGALPDVEIDGDRVRLVQVVANLLNNAAKYTPAGGRIEVRVASSGESARIEVEDSGVGIAPEFLPQVFELFSQASRGSDRAEGGLGLGLTLVRGIVDLHGGTVEARSEGAGQGSTFTVTLPCRPRSAASSAAAAADDERASPAHASTRWSVLVVDDNVDAADAIALLLRESGHDVEIANSSAHALRCARERSFDIALLDIGLPDMDGYRLAGELRAAAQPVPHIIAVTGYGRDSDRDRAFAAGFDDHLVKPVQAATLVAAMARCAAQAPMRVQPSR